MAPAQELPAVSELEVSLIAAGYHSGESRQRTAPSVNMERPTLVRSVAGYAVNQ
jgi:hypothetical protein